MPILDASIVYGILNGYYLERSEYLDYYKNPNDENWEVVLPSDLVVTGDIGVGDVQRPVTFLGGKYEKLNISAPSIVIQGGEFSHLTVSGNVKVEGGQVSELVFNEGKLEVVWGRIGTLQHSGSSGKVRVEGGQVNQLHFTGGELEVVGGNIETLQEGGGKVVILNGDLTNVHSNQSGLSIQGGQIKSLVCSAGVEVKDGEVEEAVFNGGSITLDGGRFNSMSFQGGHDCIVSLNGGTAKHISINPHLPAQFLIAGIKCDTLVAGPGNGPLSFEMTSGSVGELRADGASFSNFLLKGGKIGSCYLKSGSVNNIILTGTDIETLLEVTKAHCGEFHILSGSIAKIILKNAVQLSVSIQTQPDHKKPFTINQLIVSPKTALGLAINHGTIKEFEVSDCTFDEQSSIKMDNQTSMRVVRFSNLENDGRITLRSVTIASCDNKLEPVFSIVNSDLGDTQFINCDFGKANLHFDSSRITDIFVAGGLWPEQMTDPALTEKKRSWLMKKLQSIGFLRVYGVKDREVATRYRLGYSQLKRVFQAWGNQVSATGYYSEEMRAYYDSLPPTRRGEKFMLWLNLISNKFNASWIRALAFIAIITLTFFGAYCAALGYRFDDPLKAESWAVFGHIWEFILPIHRLDFMDANNNGWSRLWDFAGRVFIAYGIYQLVQAFRKHGRMSV